MEIDGAGLIELAERLGECHEQYGELDGADGSSIAIWDGVSSAEGGRCSGVIYVWSDRMPLSALGLDNIRRAAARLRISFAAVQASVIYAYDKSHRVVKWSQDLERYGRLSFDGGEQALVDSMVGAGATIHYPAILVHDAGEIGGKAIVGYKTTGTYEMMIRARLQSRKGAERAGSGSDRHPANGLRDVLSSVKDARTRADSLANLEYLQKDFVVKERPGAYFRAVPGNDRVAFESGGAIYLLSLDDGTMEMAPGYIDFIPSPDGRLFVTPGPRRSGLQFFDAGEVLQAAEIGRAHEVRPLFVDVDMRDQYPSVGILRSGENAGSSTIVYRVLTSWFDRTIFRDYELQHGEVGKPMLRPMGKPIVACRGYQVSLPMLSRDGSVLAGRDETTATTKLFELADDGTCTEVLDFGFATGKVAFDSGGGRLAFAVPEGSLHHGRGAFQVVEGPARELAGIFVLDRKDLRITRVPGSENVDRLAFPDFAGGDSIVFLISEPSGTKGSRFRLVCCVP